MNAPVIDASVAGRSYLYEIGNKRPDGKFNVWTQKTIRGPWPDWVVVFVANSWRAARDWIWDQEKKVAA